MTDMSQGIDLNFGGVDAILGAVPVPDGVYVLRVEDAEVVATKDQKNHMIKVMFRVDVPEGSPVAQYNGRGVFDNWMLPNQDSQTPDNFKTTYGYLRGKLEVVTGEEWNGNKRLVPRELAGYKFKALVAKVDEGYGPQNKIRTYMRLSEDEQIGLTAPSAPRPQRNGGSPSPSEGGGAEPATRFRI